MRENPLDQRRLLDARDTQELLAAAPTPLDLDREHRLQPLHPSHRGVSSDRLLGRGFGHAPRPQPAGVIAARHALAGANTSSLASLRSLTALHATALSAESARNDSRELGQMWLAARPTRWQ